MSLSASFYQHPFPCSGPLSILHHSPFKDPDKGGAAGARLKLCDQAMPLTAWCFSFLNCSVEMHLVIVMILMGSWSGSRRMHSHRKSAPHSEHSVSLAGIAVFGEWGRGESAADRVSRAGRVHRAGRLGAMGELLPAGRRQHGSRPQPQPGSGAFSGLGQRICSFACWTSQEEGWAEKLNFLIWGLLNDVVKGVSDHSWRFPRWLPRVGQCSGLHPCDH